MIFDECRHCEHRYPACQSKCETGKKLKAEADNRREKINKAKESVRLSREYIQEHYEKMRRK